MNSIANSKYSEIKESKECRIINSDKINIRQSKNCVVEGSNNCSMFNCIDVRLVNCEDLNIKDKKNIVYSNQTDVHIKFSVSEETNNTINIPLLQTKNEEECCICSLS